MTEAEISRRSLLRFAGAGISLGVLGSLVGTAHPALAATQNPAGTAGLSAPLRHLAKPGLVVADKPAAVITGKRHRVTFWLATWDGGQAYVRDIELWEGGVWHPVTAPGQRFDEQWLVLTGAGGTAQQYYRSMTPQWVALTDLTRLNAHQVRLRAAANDSFDFVVTWDVSGRDPLVEWVVTAKQSGDHVVGYQAFDIIPLNAAEEVLCGTRQHARVVLGADSLGAAELFAPMSLVQRTAEGRPLTVGVYVPADAEAFVHLAEAGPFNQPYGMSLRNGDPDDTVQPVAFAPQLGAQSKLEAGAQHTMKLGLSAEFGDLYSSYVALARQEYDLQAYRQNIYNTSLTGTLFNLVDLLLREPDHQDPAGAFVPSPSGWWARAKGFVDIELDQTVTVAHSAVLLGAYRLTGDQALYERRARPTLEYHLSRSSGSRSSPIIGHPRFPWKLGDVPGDAATLVPLHRQTGGRNAVLHELAMRVLRQPPNLNGRTPMTVPMEAYELTGNKAHLAEARAAAAVYAELFVNRPYTTNLDPGSFQYNYAKDWTELMLAYELTGDRTLLDAAYREVKRFVTMTQVRRVPKGDITVPNTPQKLDQINEWAQGRTAMWQYPRTEIPTETVPAWMVSTSGMAIEALTTFEGGGKYSLPYWVAFLLWMAHHTGDTLLRDVAHNGIVGHFTNYPGYNFRQFTSWPMHPEFPLEGPPGAGTIYYHHIPAQIGLTVDYLFAEHMVRSGKRIDYPSQFEVNYVFFKFRTYGHAPGTFYGEDGVWPYLPQGIVTLDNPQINWITATGKDSLYLSLTNESDHTEPVTIRFDPKISGVEPGRQYDVETILDNGQREQSTMSGGKLQATVSGKGISAVIVRGVHLDVPLHQAAPLESHAPDSYHLDDASPVGKVRGMLLVRPDGQACDAYVLAATEKRAVLRYTVDDGATWTELAKDIYPNEWTVPVDLGAAFTYEVVVNGVPSNAATLRLPPAVTGAAPAGTVYAEITTPADICGGDVATVDVRVWNGTSTALANPSVTLQAPGGWTITPKAAPPGAVPVGAAAPASAPDVWTFEVTVPPDATVATHTIAGTLTWDGGSAQIIPASVDVLAPVKLLAVDLTLTVLEPGESTTVTVYGVNRGPVERSGPVTVTAPQGWTVQPASTQFSLAPHTWDKFVFTVTAPADAQRETTYTITSQLWYIANHTTVSVPSLDKIVTNFSFREYFETGTWLDSGLSGYGGGSSRYSPLGAAGSTATWQPDLVASGTYEVAVWYPANTASTTAAQYVVHHRNGEDRQTVNQQQNGSQWRVLGTYDFDAGADGFVRLEVHDNAYHRASAARFKRLA
ncbi:MAG TPA: hypothetical protein VNW94_23675 [Streptosporangiaceae bacterium]|nr:hypothetical protein [Streptosporangiaceae bacterium]